MEDKIINGLIGALSMLGIGVLTLYGVIRKNSSNIGIAAITTSPALIEIGVKMGEVIRDELTQQVATLENLHRDAEKERDEFKSKVDVLLKRDRIMYTIIKTNIDPQTLKGISNMPDKI